MRSLRWNQGLWEMQQEPSTETKVAMLMKVDRTDLGGGLGYSRPIPTNTGYSQGVQQISRPVEGPRTNYRGYTYTVTLETSPTRQWVWRVYEELGDEGLMLQTGAVGGQNPNAAEQSARDWIDEYIDSISPPDDDIELDDELEEEDDDGDDDLGSQISPEFVLLGALAFLGLALIFVFDGED